MLKTLTKNQEVMLDGDTKILIKAEFVNNDLTLTSRGTSAMNSFLIKKYKKDFLAMAKEYSEIEAEENNK